MLRSGWGRGIPAERECGKNLRQLKLAAFHNQFPPLRAHVQKPAPRTGLVRSRLQERFQAVSLAKTGSEHQRRLASDSGGVSLYTFAHMTEASDSPGGLQDPHGGNGNSHKSDAGCTTAFSESLQLGTTSLNFSNSHQLQALPAPVPPRPLPSSSRASWRVGLPSVAAAEAPTVAALFCVQTNCVACDDSRNIPDRGHPSV